MATNLEKMATKLNADFRVVIKREMQTRYGIEIETRFSLFAGVISTRVDGKDFTVEQHAFMAAFGDGFASAMNIVDLGL